MGGGEVKAVPPCGHRPTSARRSRGAPPSCAGFPLNGELRVRKVLPGRGLVKVACGSFSLQRLYGHSSHMFVFGGQHQLGGVRGGSVWGSFHRLVASLSAQLLLALGWMIRPRAVAPRLDPRFW